MIRFVLPLTALASTLLVGCQTLTATPDLAEVEAVERARFQMWVKGDTDAMKAVLADDLIYCHSSAQCETKQQLMAAFASKHTIYRKLDAVTLKPRALGGAVLINGKVDIVAELNGNTTAFQAIYTDAYVKRDGRWQLVSWQSTRVP
jgi:hypothetical protein